MASEVERLLTGYYDKDTHQRWFADMFDDKSPDGRGSGEHSRVEESSLKDEDPLYFDSEVPVHSSAVPKIGRVVARDNYIPVIDMDEPLK